MSFNYQPQHIRLVHDTELNFRNQVGLMIKQERKSSGMGKFLSNHQQLLEATRKLRLLIVLVIGDSNFWKNPIWSITDENCRRLMLNIREQINMKQSEMNNTRESKTEN